MAFLFVILSLIPIVLIVRYKLKNLVMIRRFKDNNVIVFGRKGKGKDLLFQYIITKRKRENYHANIDYGYKYHHCDVKDVSLFPNDFENVLNNKVVKLKEQPFPDGEDVYLSDVGNALPSQYDYLLHKHYKGNPLYYSLSRHICANNVHCNAQNMERIWKALREQADTYIHVFKKTKIFGWIKVHYVLYDKYATALAEKKPIRVKLRKRLKEQKAIDESNDGYMLQWHFWIRTKKIKYDTRAFRKVFIEQENASVS